MFNNIFWKIYVLLFYSFIFIFFLRNFLPIDFLYFFISLFWFSLISLKWFFSNQFKWLIWNFSFKNIFSNLWIYLFIIIWIVWFFISWNIEVFLFIITWLFLVSIWISNKNLFILWFIYFIWFFVYYFSNNLDSYIYSTYLLFWICSVLIGIFYYSFEKYFEKLLNFSGKISITFFIIFLILSLYFPKIIAFLPIVLTWVLFLSSKENFKFNFFKNYTIDWIIFWLFFIIFIPIINQYLILEDKNTILLISFLVFLVIYIISNKIWIYISSKNQKK